MMNESRSKRLKSVQNDILSCRHRRMARSAQIFFFGLAAMTTHADDKQAEEREDNSVNRN